MVNKENFSVELKELLHYMESEVAVELPTPIIGVEYFIYALLREKNSNAFNILNNCLTAMALAAIEESFHRYLISKAMTIMKPGREVKYSTKLEEILEDADNVRKELFDDEITSEHVFLSIIKNESDEEKIKKVFNRAGLSYEICLNKVKSNKERKDNTYNDYIGKTDVGDDSNDTTVVSNINNDGKIIIINKTNKSKKRGDYPNISHFCVNLNDLVAKGEIDELIGRDNEMSQIIRVLGRRKKNNAILVGGAGVGKTAIGENLAFKISDGKVPEFLLNKTVISLDMTALLAGTTLRGMFEERVKGVLDEIKSDGNFILFIDNIGEVLGRKKDDYDISAMLSHALQNGDIQVIGTSDFDSYRKTFEKDSSLGRRFQKIIVEAPDLEESRNILYGLRRYYEDFHSVKYTDEAIDACVMLSDRYISERNLPDSAIDVMDEVGSYVGTSLDFSNDKMEDIKKQLNEIYESIEINKKRDDYDEVDRLNKVKKELTVKYNTAKKELKAELKKNPPVIDKDMILEIISTKTGIPVKQLTADDKKKLLTIDERLKQDVIGQDEAIDIICKALKRNRVGLTSSKCMFSALMLGKTGVGKTLIAKKLAKEIFGNESALIRFDMSEYPDKTAVNKLIGSNPGYVGYEEGGQLTEAIKNKKHCVLLLDEIEKADPEVYNIFLQVLDEGFLTDNSGMKVDFKNVIVLFTSNAGARVANDFGSGIGFNENVEENTKRILLKQLKQKFPPEFLNRLSNVIYFNNLTDDNLKMIIRLELDKMSKRVENIGYSVEFDDSIVEKLFSTIQLEKDYGARPIIRAIQDEIETPLTDKILEGEYEKNHTFKISCFSDSVTVE